MFYDANIFNVLISCRLLFNLKCTGSMTSKINNDLDHMIDRVPYGLVICKNVNISEACYSKPVDGQSMSMAIFGITCQDVNQSRAQTEQTL